MGLYKRGKIYWCQFYINGQRTQRSTGTNNKREAEQIFQELRRRANAQRHHMILDAHRLTFGELAGMFLAKSGTDYHRSRLKNLLPLFADRRLSQISRGSVDEYRIERLQRVTKATVNRDVQVLRHILFWGVDEGLLSINPLARYRDLPEPRTHKRILSLKEEDALLQFAPEHLRKATILSVDTGMRRGEVLGQRREHLDVARRLLVVSKSKTAGGVGREIPWTQRVEEILKPLAGGTGLVVLYKQRGIEELKTWWQRTIAKAGIQYLRFHDLRHTFNTRLMEAGISQDVRKALMGHSDGDINAIYTHVELPTKRHAIAKLEEWLADQRAALKQQRPSAEEEDNNRSLEPKDNLEPPSNV